MDMLSSSGCFSFCEALLDLLLNLEIVGGSGCSVGLPLPQCINLTISMCLPVICLRAGRLNTGLLHRGKVNAVESASCESLIKPDDP